MQRLARLHLPGVNAALYGYEELARVLRRYLPPSTLHLYARPKPIEGEIVEWYSELGGKPVPLLQLPAREAQAARRVLSERLAGVRQAAERLPAADHAARALLLSAAQTPADAYVYVLDGQPVLTAWGALAPAPRPAAVPSVPAAAPSVAAPVVVMAAQRRRWPWLLLLLLLLVGAPLGWWMHVYEPAAVQPEPIAVAAQAPAEPAPAPPDPLAQLRARIVQASGDCQALQTLHTSDTELQNNALVRGELVQQLSTSCTKAQIIPHAKYLCTEERPADLAPELMIAFDNSRSMWSGLLLANAEIDWSTWNPDAAEHNPKRITAARQMATTALEQLGADVQAGLLIMDKSSKPQGLFPAAQRKALLETIRHINANFGGTFLDEAITKAAPVLDGVQRPALLLLLHDAREADLAEEKFCAAARELARTKPHLTANVVDFGGSGLVKCLADATGGQVFMLNKVSDPQKIEAVMRQAAQDVLPPAWCSASR